MPVHKSKLKNGLTILGSSMPSTEAVTSLVLVRTGSRYETPRINGISHFLEHMMFKGTERRVRPIDVSRELDGVGAEFNAFTSKNYTGFYVKVSRAHFPLAMDILSDILLHSLFKVEEFERERGVVVEEINMYEDNPSMLLDDLFEQHLFGSNSLGWLIAGAKENITKLITRKDIVDYYHSHYVPNRMLVSVAGNTDAKTIEKNTRAFLPLTPSRTQGSYKKWNGVLPKERVRIRWKETQQVHLALGTSSYALEDERLPALKLLSIVLGGNMSSRLFTRVREQHGLAYMIRAGSTQYEDTGSFAVQAGLDKERIQMALKVILEELRLIAKAGVTDEELMHAKEFIRGKTLLGFEDSESVAQWYGMQWLLNKKLLTPHQRIAKVLKVTKEQVQKVAADLLKPNRLRLTLIGPFTKTAPFEKILASA